jgi:hypothetical protein
MRGFLRPLGKLFVTWINDKVRVDIGGSGSNGSTPPALRFARFQRVPAPERVRGVHHAGDDPDPALETLGGATCLR